MMDEPPLSSSEIRRAARRLRKALRSQHRTSPLAIAEAQLEERELDRTRAFLDRVRSERHHTTVLQRLAHAHRITPRQYDAGWDIARLWGASGLEGRSIGAYHAAISHRSGHGIEALSLAQMEALDQLQRILRRVGQLYAAELVRVCGCDQFPRNINDLRVALELA